MLNEKHICEKCEKDIVNSHVKEQTYDYYLKMIKRILFDKNIIQ
ncbi:sigma factor G inhibitor Gin [Clostridium neonatale]